MTFRGQGDGEEPATKMEKGWPVRRRKTREFHGNQWKRGFERVRSSEMRTVSGTEVTDEQGTEQERQRTEISLRESGRQVSKTVFEVC